MCYSEQVCGTSYSIATPTTQVSYSEQVCQSRDGRERIQNGSQHTHCLPILSDSGLGLAEKSPAEIEREKEKERGGTS